MKSMMTAALSLSCVVSCAVSSLGGNAVAPGGPYYAHFKADKESNLYKAGDKAVVEVSVTDKPGNVLREGVVDIWADDGWTNKVWSRTVDLAKESQPVKMELTRITPGSLRLRVRGRNVPVRFGFDRVIFDVDGIKPLTPCPVDFEAYWRGEQKRLDMEVPFSVEKTLEPKLCNGFRDVYRVSFPTFNGKRVYGLLGIPKGRGNGPFPAIVNVPGAGPGEWFLRGEIVMPGYVTLMMNLHDFPHCADGKEQKARYDEYLAKLVAESGEPKYQAYGFGTGRREAPIYHDALLGMARAVEWLSHETYVDSERVVYYGCSQGGGCGILLTALWGKFEKSCILCPSMCDLLAFKYGREPGSCEYVKNQSAAHRPVAEKVGPYFDACNFARLIRTPVRMMYGTADDNCNTIGGIAAFNSLSSKDKKLVLMPGKGHGWLRKGTGLEEWLFPVATTRAAETGKNATDPSPVDDYAPASIFKRGGVVLFIGDSITNGGRRGDMNHYLGHGYASEIAMRYLGYRPEKNLCFLNCGISGISTKGLLERWDRDVIHLKPSVAGWAGVFPGRTGEIKPDVVSILVGINDYLTHNPAIRTSPDEFAKNLETLVVRTHEALPACTVVVCEPFRIPEDTSPDFIARQNAVRDIARRHGCCFVDFQRLFSDVLIKENPNAKYWMWDRVHPTYAAHIRMADYWIEKFREGMSR